MTYVPETPPARLEDLPLYVEGELHRIAAAFLAVENVRLISRHRGLTKPRDGDLVLADGTDWNPGSGGGFYGYRGGRWEPLSLEGVLDVRKFGAKGDRVTDDAPAIQAALDYSKVNGDIPVYIPPAPANGSNRGYYLCNSPITIYENSRLWGAGSQAAELRFTDTDGVKTDTSSIASNWEIRGLHLRGTADTSTLTTKTAGLRVGPSNYFTIKDVYIQRFVDGVEFDSGTQGLALGSVEGVRVLSTRFPNTTNLYPRYGFSFLGSTTKPQAISFANCISYAQLSQKEASYVGDGTTTDFGVDTIGLYQTSGVQVWTKTTGLYTRRTEGTDYDLYDVTSTPTLLSPGVIADPNITRVEARFYTAPAVGESIAITWNDPTGVRGINLVDGTGISFYGLTVGGWDVNIYCNEDSNLFDVQYMQIARLGVQLTGAADNCTAVMREWPNKNIISEYSYATGLRNPTAAAGYGREPQEIECTTDYAVTTANDPIDWGGGVTYLEVQVDQPGLVHEVEADISWAATGTSRVTFRLTLEVSADLGATWSILDYVQVDYSVTGATGLTLSDRAHLHAVDRTLHFGGYSDLGTVRYRVRADWVNGSSVTVKGSSTDRSFLRARPLNRSVL